MKKIITLFALITALFLPLFYTGTSVLADQVNVIGQVCQNAANQPQICDAQPNGPGGNNPIYGPHGVLTVVVNILSIVIGIISVIVIIISGLRMIVSAGDSNSVATAKRAIYYALIGVVVAAMAQVIISFVISKTSG